MQYIKKRETIQKEKNPSLPSEIRNRLPQRLQASKGRPKGRKRLKQSLKAKKTKNLKKALPLLESPETKARTSYPGLPLGYLAQEDMFEEPHEPPLLCDGQICKWL